MYKRLLELLKLNKPRQPILQQCSVVGSKPTGEHKTFSETGGFLKSYEFEKVWIAKVVSNDYKATDCLNDDDYLDYKLWEDINAKLLYKKHLPNTMVFRGENPNIIFNGGCLGCLSQRINGFERCKGCQYFRCQWSNPDLHIKGEDAAKMDADEFRRLLGGE